MGKGGEFEHQRRSFLDAVFVIRKTYKGKRNEEEARGKRWIGPMEKEGKIAIMWVRLRGQKEGIYASNN